MTIDGEKFGPIGPLSIFQERITEDEEEYKDTDFYITWLREPEPTAIAALFIGFMVMDGWGVREGDCGIDHLQQGLVIFQGNSLPGESLPVIRENATKAVDAWNKHGTR